MGIGKHNPEDNNKETENTLSPLTLGDPEKAAYNDKPGYLQKLRSIKVRLVPLLIMAIIILAISISVVAVVAYKSGKESTENTEKPVYRYAKLMDDWTYSRGKFYYFSDKSGTWNSSQNFCISQNSSLAIIDDKEDLNFLIRHKCDGGYWIGLSRKTNAFDWVWTNGIPYTETIFKINDLTTASSKFDHVFLNGNVTSDDGTEEKRWICNKKLVLPTE